MFSFLGCIPGSLFKRISQYTDFLFNSNYVPALPIADIENELC